MLAVLGVLAYRTLKGKGRLADLLGTGSAATAGSPKSSGPSGAELSGGLADLLARFRQAKQEKTQSWVSIGPNRSIAPHELEQALGEERVQWLVEQTGTSKDELLVGLSKALPKAVDPKVAFRPQRSWSASDKVKVWRAAVTESSIRRTRVSPAGRCALGRASHPWCAAKHRSLAPRLSWLGWNGEQILFKSALRGPHWKPVAVRLANAMSNCT